jgi:MtN3 and saliva related transmembrane protein
MGEEHLTSSRGLMRVALSAKNMAWIPQIIQVWVHKRHDGISLATFAVVSFALGLWLLYGILVDSFAMIAANIMTLTVIGAVIIGVYRVRKSEAESQL